ncbi:MAG: PaaI family thioesterase [Paracoccaceae bacterium]
MVDKTAVARSFIEAIPYAHALGLEVDHIGEGEAVMSLPWSADIVGDPERGVVHGGAVSAAMDTCCGAAVMSHPSLPSTTATIDLRIDYMRAATKGQTIVTTATCYHVGRNVAFVRAVATDNDTDKPVALATGSFTVER